MDDKAIYEKIYKKVLYRIDEFFEYAYWEDRLKVLDGLVRIQLNLKELIEKYE